MFKFLKEKINSAVEKISKKTEEEIVIEEKVEEESKGIIKKITEKVTTKKIPEKKFDEIFFDIELALLENNVALEVIEKIKEDLKNQLLELPTKRSETETLIKDTLKKSIKDLLIDPPDIVKQIKNKKPFTICFVGVNGAGKTTTLVKFAKLLQNNKLSCVFAASDTFRAASIEQLEQQASKLDVKVIKHDYGSDPAAVAFDAVNYAKSKKIDTVLIDTSGRLHSNTDLMDELKKITRVANPDLTIFIGEAITGNDCIEQASKFNEMIGIDAIILSKQDIDEKGGASISVSYITKRPILYLGCGQGLDDLEKFDANKILEQLGL